LYFLLK